MSNVYIGKVQRALSKVFLLISRKLISHDWLLAIDSLTIVSAYLYWSGGVERFKFDLERRLPSTATLFLPGDNLALISCGEAVSVTRSTTTTWVALASPRPMTHVSPHFYPPLIVGCAIPFKKCDEFHLFIPFHYLS
jgi:hypothetical protein